VTAIPNVHAGPSVVPTLSRPRRGISIVAREWLSCLVSLLGIFQIGLAVSARPMIAAIGVVSGLLVVAAPWVARRNTAVGLAALIAGTLPFAVVTWWSILAPFVCLLALAIGLAVIVRSERRR
jgi:hypothetical protein